MSENVDGGRLLPTDPINYDRLYHGPVSVRTALANSYNIPAVKVLERIGVETLRELASQAGISTFTDQYGLALTLGGGDVRLLELTAAYGIFDDGHAVTPRAISGVYDERSASWRSAAPLRRTHRVKQRNRDLRRRGQCRGTGRALAPGRLPHHRHPL